jgi:hypothetical protein
VHGQQQPNQPQQQGGVAPMQQPGRTNGGGEPGTSNNSADINAIPANMVVLFQQFLASIANKDETKGSGNQEMKEDKAEKSKLEKEESAKEIAESSAQGEARGNNATTNPYCYRCLTRGHPKEECDVHLFCDVY